MFMNNRCLKWWTSLLFLKCIIPVVTILFTDSFISSFCSSPWCRHSSIRFVILILLLVLCSLYTVDSVLSFFFFTKVWKLTLLSRHTLHSKLDKWEDTFFQKYYHNTYILCKEGISYSYKYSTGVILIQLWH